MTNLEAFPRAFCSWDLSGQAAFLNAAGKFLALIGRPDLEENERTVQLKRAHLALSPLRLNNLQEPHRQISCALQAAADFNVTSVERDVC
jgi:hypothetical protein